MYVQDQQHFSVLHDSHKILLDQNTGVMSLDHDILDLAFPLTQLHNYLFFVWTQKLLVRRGLTLAKRRVMKTPYSKLGSCNMASGGARWRG